MTTRLASALLTFVLAACEPTGLDAGAVSSEAAATLVPAGGGWAAPAERSAPADEPPAASAPAEDPYQAEAIQTQDGATDEPVGEAVEEAAPPLAPADPCAPVCGDIECGSSTCEASCGTCAEGKCLGGFCHAGCYMPPGSRGTNPGQMLPNVNFYDCDGNPVATDDFCGVPVTVLFSFHGTCPMSLAHATLAQQLQPLYKDQGVRFVLVLTNLLDGSIPTAQACKEIRKTFGATYSVLFDPKGQFGEKLAHGTDQVFVTTSKEGDGNRILARQQKPSFTSWLVPLLDSVVE